MVRRIVKVMSLRRKIGGCLAVAVGGTATCMAYMSLTGDETFYSSWLMPLIRATMDGENAHKFALWMASWGMVPRWTDDVKSDRLKTRVLGIDFENPIGMSAGFDKSAEALGGLFRMGFGFVEVGSVTPLPQSGSPKPRVFRLLEDKAVINRYGFPNDGAVVVSKRVQEFRDAIIALRTDSKNVLTSIPSILYGPPHDHCILGVSLGGNRGATDPVAEYTTGLNLFSENSDYIVFNLACPHVHGPKALHNEGELDKLLKSVDAYFESNKVTKRPKVLLKLSPDMKESELAAAAKVAMKWSPRVVSGFIMGNPSGIRPETLKSPAEICKQFGGLSGKPICKLTTQQVARLYKITGGKLPIIGVGGVSSGQDAYEKITAGASLIQLYVAMIYEGPPVIQRIKRELDDELAKNGFKTVSEAVGTKANDLAK